MRGLDPRIHRAARTTDALLRSEHREDVVDGFTKKYGVHRLVYFEPYDNVRVAIQRERTMEHWRRDWKIALIERENPHWRDLYDDIAR